MFKFIFGAAMTSKQDLSKAPLMSKSVVIFLDYLMPIQIAKKNVRLGDNKPERVNNFTSYPNMTATAKFRKKSHTPLKYTLFY